MQKLTPSHRLGISFVLSLCVACGGGAAAGEGAKAPTGAAAPSATNEGGVATTPQGQQFAVSDAPTSGEAAAARPAMNASAQSAYQAGMQAFQAGDLQGAKNQFVSATSADPMSSKRLLHGER